MTMKAAILDGYDKNGRALAVRDIPVPEPAASEVLVRVHAAGVNPLDNMIVRGEVKLITPYAMPLVMGNELAGVVEKVGPAVRRLKVGDRVYGRLPLAKIGAFAEYAAVDEGALAVIPGYLSFEEAATVPLTSLTAIQALDLLDAKAGQTLFIPGGTGSLGAMAIPIAVRRGLRVITSGSAANRERVLRLGAERFIDYRTEDYATELSGIDLVLDTLGDDEVARELGVLRTGGRLVSLKGMPNGRFAKRMGMPALKRLLFAAAGHKLDRLASSQGKTYDFLFVHEDGLGLDRLAQDFDAAHPLPTSVDAVFDLDQVNGAMEKVRAGRSKGKTILRVR